jgi:hypothetical protein
MKCPNCNNDITYSKSWKISRWTSIECSRCHTLCNRKLDIQVFLVFLLSIIGWIGVLLIASFIILNWGSILGVIFGISLALLWMLFILYLDSKTYTSSPSGKALYERY